MRRFILALILLLAAAPALAGSLIARQGDDRVTLNDAPCLFASVLMRIAEDQRDSYQRAEAVFGGKRFFACWRMVGNSAHLVYEDGDVGVIPAHELKPALEI